MPCSTLTLRCLINWTAESMIRYQKLLLPLTKGRNLIVVGDLGIFTGILAKVIRNKTRIRIFGGILDLFSPILVENERLDAGS